MSLAEFLLARIAGDEAAAFRWHDMECDLPLAGMDGLRMAAEVPGAVCDCGGPARVLAECNAKRRIVRNYLGWPGVLGETAQVVTEELTWTLRLLAVPYADHPDFREEWKP